MPASNDNVSVAAPGGGMGDCRHGVFSTLPSSPSLWDGSCSAIFAPAEAAPARWAYGEGTSFAAPLASAAAALTLQANPNLLPEQLAQVIKASAQQTLGEGWNSGIGLGIVDAAAAVDLARRYDTLEPQAELRVVPGARSLTVRLEAADVAREGEETANGITVSVERSRDGAQFESWLPEQAAVRARAVKASRRGPAYWFRAIVCDANQNCTVAKAGPRRPLRVKPRVILRTRKLPDGRGRAIVTLKRVKGLNGRARVVLERRVDGRFRPIARFKLSFGASAKRPIELDEHSPVRLRARVQSTPDWRGVRSRAISIVSPAAR